MTGILGRLLLFVPLLAMGVAAGAPAVSATQECTGTVYEETFAGDLMVPAGAVCELYDVDVRGDISIAPGGSLQVVDSGVRGSITGAEIFYVVILRAEVRGSITVQGAAGAATFVLSEVRGGLTYSGIAGEGAYLQDSTVRRGATLNENASITIIRTTVRGDLACSGNGWIGVESGDNSVRGQRSGDCAGL